MADFNEGGLPDLGGKTMTPQQIDNLVADSNTDGAPVQGLDDQISQPGRAPAPPPVAPEPEGPAVLKHSTGDRTRDSIAKGFKRDNSDEYDSQDLTNALFGVGHNTKARTDGAVEDAQDTIAQADTTQTRSTNPERIHGNTNVQLVVNSRPMTMAMRDVRQLLIDNGVDDLDQIPDKAQIASARTLLAARMQLDAAKAQRQPQASEAPPQAPQEAPRRQAPPPQPDVDQNPDEATNTLIHEIQFGDAEQAARMLKGLIQEEARKVAYASTQNNLRETQHAAMMRGVNEVTEEFNRKPEFQAIMNDKRTIFSLQTEAQNAMTEALLEYYSPEELQRFDSIEARGTLYRELASQGLKLPSERDLTRKAYEATIQRLSPQRSSAAPTQQSTPQPRSQPYPNVQLSPERQARARTVAPPPRVSSAQPTQTAVRTPTDVVMGMRKARGQIA